MARRPRKPNRTPAQAAADRKALAKQSRKHERATARARLVDLKGAIKASRVARRASLAAAVAACKALRADARRRAADVVAGGALACEIGKTRARVEGRAAVAAATGAAADETRAQRRLRPLAVRSTESDDQVRGNIPPELVGLFNRVRSHIKGSDRMTRTEAFLQYAEEHPAEYLDALEDRTDAMIREHDRSLRRANAPTRTSPTSSSTSTGWWTRYARGPRGKVGGEVRVSPAWWKLTSDQRRREVGKLARSRRPIDRRAAVELARAEGARARRMQA